MEAEAFLGSVPEERGGLMQRDAVLAGSRGSVFGTTEEGIVAELSGRSVESHLGNFSKKTASEH